MAATTTAPTEPVTAAKWEPLYIDTNIPGEDPVQASSGVLHRYNANGRMFSSPFWSGMYAVGKVFSWPTTTLVSLFCRSFLMPFRPGRFGQMKSAGAEFLVRLVAGVVSFLLVPLALVLILFGILFRALAVGLGKKDLTFKRPSTNADSQTNAIELTETREPPSRIVLRTQNLGFIPHVSPVNGMAVPPKRAPAMFRHVKGGIDDVICLQELFDLTVIDKFIHEVGAGSELSSDGQDQAALYPWALCDVDPKPYRLNSGLFVGSRYPIMDPEFIRFSIASRDDILAGKGVLGCTGHIAGRPCKLTLFTTHAQAGHYMQIHTYQFRAIMEFMKYYNRKYLHDNDIIVASLLMGDYNLGPVSSRPDPVTGKMRMNDEWAVMNAIFSEYGMRNFYYEKTAEGIARTRNREIILQLQDLWYEEGLRVWERHNGIASREGQDLERAEGRHHDRKGHQWQMDIFSLLQALSGLMNSIHHDAESVNREVIEEALKRELISQVERHSAKGKKTSAQEPMDAIGVNVAAMVDLVAQLSVLPDEERDGGTEKVIPGSAIEMSTYRTRFPTEVKLCDIDHVLMPKRINGRKPIAKRAHIKLVTQSVVEFTDHYGKRTTLDIDWSRLTADSNAASHASMSSDSIDLQRSREPKQDSLLHEATYDVEGPGKERILINTIA